MSAPAAIELPTAPIGQAAVSAAVNAADAVVNEPAKIATKPDEKKVVPPPNQVLDVVEFYSQFQGIIMLFILSSMPCISHFYLLL
jgi:hypothetical protein